MPVLHGLHAVGGVIIGSCQIGVKESVATRSVTCSTLVLHTKPFVYNVSVSTV